MRNIILAAALLMIVSCVFVRTRYTSDVLGGAVTGIIAAALACLVYREGTRAVRYLAHVL